jgi:acyl carrier protein
MAGQSGTVDHWTAVAEPIRRRRDNVMAGSDWPEEFEALLRCHLSDAGESQVVGVNDSLTNLGLDSLATVGLLMELEETFDIIVPVEMLTPDSFRTPGSLWEMVSGLRDRPNAN